MKKGAFTLVELIVVITILAILATIGFVSFSGYLAWTRDTNRVAQLKSMSDALELYSTKKSLPIPDDKVDIKAGTKTIAYQGYIWKNVLETIEYTESWLDPKDKQYFSYYLTSNKKYFQFLTYLEEENEDVLALNSMGTLNAIDYTNRFPKVTGRRLWILTDKDNNPIQDIAVITWSWYLDILNTNQEYTAYISDAASLTWTWESLKILKALVESKWKWFACKWILESWVWTTNGIYKIFSWNKVFDVLCDMTNDWWGWTLIDGVSDRFGQVITSVPEINPNIDNYSMAAEKLYWILNTIDKPIFKFKIDRDWMNDNLELNIQVDDIQGYLKSYKRNLTDWEKIESSSWVTMNWWIVIQPKITKSFTRVTLKRVKAQEYYWHLKSYSQKWPHSWWLKQNGYFGQLYLNKSITTVGVSSLPTFWGLFTWDGAWWHYLVAAWETYASAGYEWHNFPSLANKNLIAWLWLR